MFTARTAVFKFTPWVLSQKDTEQRIKITTQGVNITPMSLVADICVVSTPYYNDVKNVDLFECGYYIDVTTSMVSIYHPAEFLQLGIASCTRTFHNSMHLGPIS